MNTLARRRSVVPGQEVFGKAFENWICHELRAHASYSQKHYEIRYWRLATGTEVDFVLGDLEVAIEVKATDRIRPQHLAGLEDIRSEHPGIGQRILVCMEGVPRRLANDIIILPALTFLERLWAGEIV